MLLRNILNLLAACLLMVLAGCGPEYTYTPPTSAMGQSCVMQCQRTQTDCSNTERAKADIKQSRCEEDAEHEHYFCLLYAKTDADRAKCEKPGCYEYADTAHCNTDFRACFQLCGGIIGILKK